MVNQRFQWPFSSSQTVSVPEATPVKSIVMMVVKIEGKINGKSHLESMMTGGAHMIQETTIWILMGTN